MATENIDAGYTNLILAGWGLLVTLCLVSIWIGNKRRPK